MNLRIKNTTGIIYEGNTLSGNTFPVKDWIKSKVDGKWDANRKMWVVNSAQVDRWLKAGAIHADNSQPAQTTGTNGYCRKCHSYCYGDCEAN